ncbi:MAG: RdgB/HAM1 family non-canonical purine NTP pyrophosphatase [Dehalococcoidia bacterium]
MGSKALKPKLLLATRNPGKARELRQLLSGVPFHLVSLEETGVQEEVEETGDSFEENATLKGRFYARLSGLLTLAEDSGLEVDALAGGPGVHSARYGGPGLSDGDRVRLLLQKLEGVSEERRGACFRCAIAIAWPSGEVRLAEGELRGRIAFEAQGGGGFGYDPVFYLPELGRTNAQLSLEEKNRLSHRGQAARKAAALLRNLRAEVV